MKTSSRSYEPLARLLPVATPYSLRRVRSLGSCCDHDLGCSPTCLRVGFHNSFKGIRLHWLMRFERFFNDGRDRRPSHPSFEKSCHRDLICCVQPSRCGSTGSAGLISKAQARKGLEIGGLEREVFELSLVERGTKRRLETNRIPHRVSNWKTHIRIG